MFDFVQNDGAMECDLIQPAVGGSTSRSWRLAEYYRVEKKLNIVKIRGI